MADCTGTGSCVPWSPDMSCCPDWGDLDDALLCKAQTLAWDTLRVLSGGQVGNCPVLIRPCLSDPCEACLVPDPRVGLRRASTCGSAGCSCAALHEVVLPGPVAEVWQVNIDGVTLAVDDYRVDNGNRLLLTGGQSWPSCQDISKGPDEVGSVGIWYVPGIVPDSAGLWAAGVLTCEFSKACSGAKCRLPSAVTSISRQGVSMEISTGMFPDGMTGIREVDAYLTSINPNALRVPPKVWSPDIAGSRHRFTTWKGAPEVPAS